MPAYKDEKNGWYWQGNKKRKKKRGFSTKKEALCWEASFKLMQASDMDMCLSDFVEVYFRDKEKELKSRTIKNKRYMMEAHIIPYLGGKSMNKITPSDIIAWQNSIQNKGFSQTYLRMIQNQITAIFTHASKVYDLTKNPCKKVKKMGKSDAEGIDFWTVDEYKRFISTIPKGTKYYVLFEVLFWTGVRIGEALALTKADIDFANNRLRVDKTYYRQDRQDVITRPKTAQSVRTIELPVFLTEEIRDYVSLLYGIPDNERIFPVGAEAVQHMLKDKSSRAGVKKIRVHDLRHSHVAYLINKGIEPLVIKERLGHKDIRITLNTYGHLYPSRQREIADMLDSANG